MNRPVRTRGILVYLVAWVLGATVPAWAQVDGTVDLHQPRGAVSLGSPTLLAQWDGSLTTASPTGASSGFEPVGGPLDHHVYQRTSPELPTAPRDSPLPRYERMGRMAGRRSRPVTIDALFFGRAGVDDPSTNVKMTEIGASYQHRIPLADRVLVTIRPFADILFLSGPGGPAPVLPEQLYKVAVDFQGDFQFNDWLGFSVGVTPGFWTDFVRFTSDEFRLPARVLGTVRVQDNLFVAGGLQYTDNIRRNLLPAFGILWDPLERVRLELVYPRSRLAYFLHDEWQVYGVLERGGDTYNLRTHFGGLSVDEDFEYRDVRFLLGTQYDAWQWASLFVEAGVVFARKFRFDFQPDRDINPAFLLRVGTRF